MIDDSTQPIIYKHIIYQLSSMASPVEKKVLEMFETLILSTKSTHESSTVDPDEPKKNAEVPDVDQSNPQNPQIDVPIKSGASQNTNAQDNAFVASMFEEGNSSKQDEGNKN